MSNPSNPLAGVKALLCDVFGTVVNWQDSVHAQIAEKCNQDSLSLGELDLLDFTKVWRAGYMRRTKAIAAGEPGPTNVDVLHRELLDELLEKEEYAVLAGWSDVERTEICQYWHRLKGWPGSSEGIAGIHKIPGEGILIGTLSNGSARLLIDLAKYADLNWNFVFSADLLKAYKPNPAMYLGGCALLALKPEECAMVASHIYDLKSAASYGLRTIYIPRETEDQGLFPGGPSSVRPKSEGGEVDVVISSLAELPGLFM